MNFPESFWNTLPPLSISEKKAIIDSHNAQPHVSVRYNPFKPVIPFTDTIPVSWAHNSAYLPSRPSFTADPLWHAGAYYVQEASSMFLEQAFIQHVNLEHSQVALDLCAAPGGKSTHIASLLSPDSILFSNEVIANRAGILADNMSKWGRLNTWVTHSDPRQWGRLEALVDLLIVDAPCSGSGLFRKMPEYINEWSSDLVALCAQRQQRILHDAYPVLKKDGLLIYMTCSMSVAENEEIIDHMISQYSMQSLPISLHQDWGVQEVITPNGAVCYRLAPHMLKGEGFFLAVLQKNYGKHKNVLPSKQKQLKNNISNVFQFIQPEIHSIITHGDYVVAIHPAHSAYLDLQGKIKINKRGVLIGKNMKNDIVPEHELALYTGNHFPHTIALTLQQAQLYLQKEVFPIDIHQKGWYLATYQGLALGWIKQLGNRFNNYFPTNSRILSKNILT